MTEELFYWVVIIINMTVGIAGIFGWLKYKNEADCRRILSAENLRLTMENYNLHTRKANIIPINKRNKAGIVGFDIESGNTIKQTPDMVERRIQS